MNSLSDLHVDDLVKIKKREGFTLAKVTAVNPDNATATSQGGTFIFTLLPYGKVYFTGFTWEKAPERVCMRRGRDYFPGDLLYCDNCINGVKYAKYAKLEREE